MLKETAPTPSSGPVAVVTAGTGGIGIHTAIGLARAGARVVVTGRDPVRGAAAVSRIEAEARTGRVELLTADLSSQAEVRRLAGELSSRHDRIGVLVNNVGGLYTSRWETTDGIEASLAVNALNPFLLTTLLLPVLTDSRVVYVTGGMPGKIEADNLAGERGYIGLRTYSHAKTIMMALALEQSRRLDPARVTVNVAYPGGADTPMTRAMTPATVPPAMRMLWPVFKPFLAAAKPERASRSCIALATEARWTGMTGTYVNTRTRPTSWPVDVRDDALRARLWLIAEEMTGIGAGPGIPGVTGRIV